MTFNPATVGATLSDNPTTAAWIQWVYQAAAWLSYRAAQRGIRTVDPLLLAVIMRLESGRDLDHELSHGFNFWGIKGEYGPQLSGAAAELFDLPALAVDRDNTWLSSSGTNWRAYPTPIHAVADQVRMLSTGRYSSVPQQPTAAAQLQEIQARGYHPNIYWVARTWLQLAKFALLTPAQRDWARANIGDRNAT